MKTRTFVWCIGLLLAGIGGAALAASPFVGSRSESHGVLYLNVNQAAKQIWPVKIWAVDGALTNRSDQGVLWIKPGDYTFKVKLGAVNMADVPGLSRRASYGQDAHDLKLSVQAGTAYYIGAKFAASGKWEPVVWKTEAAKD
ncbi:MAG: hypothetical protein KGL98_09215 [Gammaproteobacteria bacterium]|nr:hypothetical protein [Gammaproteobacteria bacterium]MBU6509616.1 hypothetical protein [Gammaproteobacteria bacterium]MDE1983728.1 hypothetical protein [Gammaproteobacteria bacterium]MDE2461414.1 hypothetical protein [Gammaproteobacteria bacterium]